MHISWKRSGTNYKIAGVLGGIAEHFGWNANVLRVLWLLLTITPAFPGVIIYLVLWLLMEKPDQYIS
ncbi:Stress-responsive transcription regulator [Bombilactobacillus mellis]|uniref:Stress-responsive transcription regulator n=1 Tax=Bombilactobacillus mellis TaxID=1218508 RepID=A0A0F4KPT2_9LACO|nr:PspC domain-containing protein [Bombilactobacillus mellis]MBI0107390.1 PspC domain-containing protein [Lactobacillus sp. W8086]MBI0108855.1 PspC domain-containing protein [Lactobacillus sp. W8085]MBI0112072.1 PspC domain-containing protein [Lactobacillus sp. W8088]MBI0115788.1 PspC domain-containing protein [Lactobacillus sp. W8087]MBI0119512.1 PspC domain-containing protein [Lactobacillus sp. W8089]MBI0131478.1 PspC domain-containing protein [Lactobacillus sp. W8090]